MPRIETEHRSATFCIGCLQPWGPRQTQHKAQQDAERASAQQQKEAAASRDSAMDPGSDQMQEERQKLEDYEEALHAIKDATGVDDVNEVIQKFLTQERRPRLPGAAMLMLDILDGCLSRPQIEPQVDPNVIQR